MGAETESTRWRSRLRLRKQGPVSGFERTARRDEGHPINGKVGVVCREDRGSSMTAGQQDGARVGIIHARFPLRHFIQHINGRGVFDLHALHECS